MKLSYSKIDTYLTCPKMYKLKYIDKWDGTAYSSALWYGTAVGRVFAAMTLHLKDELTTKEEKSDFGRDPYELFDELITTSELNGEKINIKTSPAVRYFKGDFDARVLKDEDYDEIDGYRKSKDLPDDWDFDYLWSRVESREITLNELLYLNLVFWISVRRKGHLMIDEFKLSILPKIKKVYETEGAISIKNQVGDEITGLLDMLCDYEFDDGIKRVIIDFKTSSTRYPKKKLSESAQLGLYDYDRDIGTVGYIVAVKALKEPKKGERKGELYIDIQELFGQTSEENTFRVLHDADQVLQKIKDEEFPMTNNRGTCDRHFGKQCIYKGVCYNDDYTGLVKRGEK